MQTRSPSFPFLYRRQIARRVAGAGGLLEGEGELDERRFAESAPHEGDADGQFKGVACRDSDGRVAGQGCWLRAAAEVMIAVDEIDAPCRACRWHDQRVEPVFIHHGIDRSEERR